MLRHPKCLSKPIARNVSFDLVPIEFHASIGVQIGMLCSLLVLSALLGADSTPIELLKADGELVIDDGASFFVFKADGVFHSFPHGISGRVLLGRWKKTQESALLIEAIAKQTWQNGVFANDDYRKLVFAIYSGKSRLKTATEVQTAGVSFEHVFQGYWLLEEFVKIAKPKSKAVALPH
jgi:hypothetical protein